MVPVQLVMLELERRGTRLLKHFFTILAEDIPRLRRRLSNWKSALIYTPDDHSKSSTVYQIESSILTLPLKFIKRKEVSCI